MLINSEGEMQPASLWSERLPPLMLYEARTALLLFGNMIVEADKDKWSSYSILRDFLQVCICMRHAHSTCPKQL
jgi:hypothetical protein